MKKLILKALIATSSIIFIAANSSCTNSKKDDTINHANTPREEPGDQYKVPNDSAGNRADTSKNYQH